MNQALRLRPEMDSDVNAITDVTVAAFKNLEVSDHTEQFVVTALRAAKALTVSLVAELDGRVIGHIAFSPVMLSDGTSQWFGLGPVSVLPEFQRQGIGKALIEEGLSRLKGINARGCCLVGHPAYYRKFGFKNTPELGLEGVPPEVFLPSRLTGTCRTGPSPSTTPSGRTTRSLSDLEIVGCKSAAAVHFLPSFCPIAGLWGCKSGKNCPRRGQFSLSTLQVRQPPRFRRR